MFEMKILFAEQFMDFCEIFGFFFFAYFLFTEIKVKDEMKKFIAD